MYNVRMNPKTLEAVYKQGMLRPLEQLDFPEDQIVQMTVVAITPASAKSVANCYDLAQKAGMIGALKNAPADLSTNPEHFQGFGSP